MKSLKNRNARETVLNIINKYYDHEDECINFFIRAKWPEGFECNITIMKTNALISLSERNGLKGLNVNVAAMNTICLIPGKMY